MAVIAAPDQPSFTAAPFQPASPARWHVSFVGRWEPICGTLSQLAADDIHTGVTRGVRRHNRSDRQSERVEIDHVSGRLRLSRMLFTATRYPHDYGFVDDTLSRVTRSMPWSSCRNPPPRMPHSSQDGRHAPHDRRGWQNVNSSVYRPITTHGTVRRHLPSTQVGPDGDPTLLRGVRSSSQVSP